MDVSDTGCPECCRYGVRKIAIRQGRYMLPWPDLDRLAQRAYSAIKKKELMLCQGHARGNH
jgi:hypothetical protein